MTKLTLPTDSDERKEIPILSGVVNYFPAALAEVAKISVAGNRKHNPDSTELHHARGKSMDHGDCILRHTMDIEDLKANIKRRSDKSPVVIDQLIQEAAYRAWRSLAELQQLCEEHRGLPLAPAATLPTDVMVNMAINQVCAHVGIVPPPLGGLLRKGSAAAQEYERVAAMHRRLEPGVRASDGEWREDDIGVTFPDGVRG